MTTQDASFAATQGGHRRAILFLALASFAAAATTRVMDAVLPQMAVEFGVSIGSVAFVATAYAFAYGAFQLVFGPLGDRFGKFRVILFSCFGACAMTFACAFSTTLGQIAGARLLSGMMAAAIVPLAIAWVGDVVAHEDRQPILARFMSSQILGLLAGQIGGGVLGEFFGWRSAFLLIGSAYLFALVGMSYELRRNPAVVIVSEAGAGGMRHTLRVFAGLWRRPVVRFVLVMVSIEAFAMFGALTYVGASLHYRFGFDFASVGMYLAVYCFGGLFYVSQSRRMLARLGSQRLAFWGTVLVAGCYTVMALTPVHHLYVPAIAVMGVGFYMLHNTLQTMATQMAPDVRGSAVAIFATFYFLSQAVGVWLAGQVMDRWGVAPVFLTAAAMLLALGVLLLRFMPAELRVVAMRRG